MNDKPELLTKEQAEWIENRAQQLCGGDPHWGWAAWKRAVAELTRASRTRYGEDFSNHDPGPEYPGDELSPEQFDQLDTADKYDDGRR